MSCLHFNFGNAVTLIDDYENNLQLLNEDKSNISILRNILERMRKI